MASVTFSGSKNGYYVHIGGISGELYSSKYGPTVKNCANYGGITHFGQNRNAYIGGIVGHSSYYWLSERVYIYNSLNHGTITHNGTTSGDLHIGGIAGYTYRTFIENCVSGGKFSLTKASGKHNYIGSLVGSVSSNTTINYCYSTSDLSGYDKCGQKDSTLSESNIFDYDNIAFEMNETVSVGDYTGNTLIEALNAYSDYYPLSYYSHWLLNKNGNSVTFINGKANPIEVDYQVILLLSLANEGNKSFLWYTDNEFTKPPTEYEVTSDTKLYERYCGPNYTGTFNPNGGSTSQSIKEVTFAGVYGELPTPNRTGYAFFGWFNEKNESITEESIVKVPRNHTLCARWLEISRYVEIVFSTKDMTREEIENAVKKYTDTDFVIVEIESGAEEMRVIVGFFDAEVAEEFVRNVNAELGRGEKDLIKRTNFVQEGTGSFSVGCYPMMFLLYLI